MKTVRTSYPGLLLVAPDPPLHAPVTLSWFESEYGKETLLLMGNADHEIDTPTLDNEIQTLNEFVELEKEGKQFTWMIQFENKIIGVAWIELTTNHNVQPPSIHLMMGDKEYRGRGIGKATMLALIQYIKETTNTETIYSRHLKSNSVVTNMNQSIGFADDGDAYTDENGLKWQNTRLAIRGSDAYDSPVILQ